MRWSRRQARTVQRTCFECGEVWTVDARLARVTPPARRRSRFSVGTVLGAQRDLTRYRAFLTLDESRQRQTPASLELQMLREVGKCRMCGSTHYIETEI